jgi:hypothetical protein
MIGFQMLKICGVLGGAEGDAGRREELALGNVSLSTHTNGDRRLRHVSTY